MSGEFDVLGIFVPALLVYAVIAFVLKEGVCRLLSSVGAYRFVWHRPLFDTALFILLLGSIVILVHSIKS